MKPSATFIGIVINLVLALALGGYWSTASLNWQPPAPLELDPDLLTIPAIGRTAQVPGQFAATLARPLFSATRRPIVATSVEVSADEIEQFSLLGLFGSGETAGVLIQTGGRVERVELGEQAAGWVLKKVRGQVAVFQRGAETREKKLKQRSHTPAQPPAQPSQQPSHTSGNANSNLPPRMSK